MATKSNKDTNVVAINEENTYFFNMLVTSAGFSRKDGETSVYLTGKPDVDLSDVLAECFKSSQKKYIPKWFKEERETITLKSNFRVPVRMIYEDDDDFEDISFEEWCNLGVKDAIVRVKAKIGSGACYVNAVKVRKAGEPYDPFADFNL